MSSWLNGLRGIRLLSDSLNERIFYFFYYAMPTLWWQSLHLLKQQIFAISIRKQISVSKQISQNMVLSLCCQKLIYSRVYLIKMVENTFLSSRAGFIFFYRKCIKCLLWAKYYSKCWGDKMMHRHSLCHSGAYSLCYSECQCVSRPMDLSLDLKEKECQCI